MLWLAVEEEGGCRGSIVGVEDARKCDLIVNLGMVHDGNRCAHADR
jgi:hypothetical protein